MDSTDRLVRGIGLAQATALNMIDMIGVGPFITIPLMVAAMHGPQAMLGWIVGAGLVLCAGMGWVGLGARVAAWATAWSGPSWAPRCRRPAGLCAISRPCTGRASETGSPSCL